MKNEKCRNDLGRAALMKIIEAQKLEILQLQLENELLWENIRPEDPGELNSTRHIN